MKKKVSRKLRTPILSIIIPVYNEKENIKKTLQTIKQNVSEHYEVIVVYDIDNDTTLPILHRLRRVYKNLSFVKNTVARGPSGAIRTGIRIASAPRILVTMADLSDNITQINTLVKLVPKYADIACPSRYCKGGKQQLNSRFKVWLPRLAGLLLHFLSGIPTYDPTNSFKLYSKKLFQTFSLSSTISFSVTLEIMAKAHCLGFRIIEIPTIWKDRRFGKTNFKLLDSLVAYFPWLCLALMRNRLFSLPISWIRRILVNYPD